MSSILRPYRQTLRFLRQRFMFVVLITVVYWAFQIASVYFAIGFAVKAVPYIIIFYVLIRAMLLDETRLSKLSRPYPVGWFILTCVLIFAIVLITSLITFLIYDGMTGFQSTAETRIVPLFFVLLICCGVVLGGFGTMIPAAAIGDPRDFADRVVGAFKAFPRVFMGLLFGPCLCVLASFAALAVIDARFDLMVTPYDPETGFSLTQMLVFLPIRFGGILIGCLAAAVLIEAYRDQAPARVAPRLYDPSA